MRYLKNILYSGVLYFLFGNIIVKLLGFISNIAIGRLVDKADYAAFSYADNIYAYVISIGGLGLAVAMLRSMARTEDTNLRNAYFKYTIQRGALIQTIIVVGILVITSFLHLPFEDAYAYLCALALWPLLDFLFTTNSNYLRALYKNKAYFLMSILSAGIMLLIILVSAEKVGAFSVPLARIIATFVVLFISLLCIKKSTVTTKTSYVLSREEKRKHFSTGIAMMTASFFSTIMMTNNAFLVNNFIRDEVTTANYKIAILFPTQLTILTNSIINYAFPHIAKGAEDKELTWNNSKKVGISNFIVIALCAVVGFLASGLILKILYGEKYLDSLELMRAFWIVIGLNAGLRMVPMNIMAMIGYERINSVISLICCGAHIVLTIPMLKIFGVFGCVYSLAIIYPMTSAVYWILLYKVTKGSKAKGEVE